jgi:hypothetical protein
LPPDPGDGDLGDGVTPPDAPPEAPGGGQPPNPGDGMPPGGGGDGGSETRPGAPTEPDF